MDHRPSHAFSKRAVKEILTETHRCSQLQSHQCRNEGQLYRQLTRNPTLMRELYRICLLEIFTE